MVQNAAAPAQPHIAVLEAEVRMEQWTHAVPVLALDRIAGAGSSGSSWSICGVHIRQASVTSSRISASPSRSRWAHTHW